MTQLHQSNDPSLPKKKSSGCGEIYSFFVLSMIGITFVFVGGFMVIGLGFILIQTVTLTLSGQTVNSDSVLVAIGALLLGLLTLIGLGLYPLYRAYRIFKESD